LGPLERGIKSKLGNTRGEWKPQKPRKGQKYRTQMPNNPLGPREKFTRNSPREKEILGKRN